MVGVLSLLMSVSKQRRVENIDLDKKPNILFICFSFFDAFNVVLFFKSFLPFCISVVLKNLNFANVLICLKVPNVLPALSKKSVSVVKFPEITLIKK